LWAKIDNKTDLSVTNFLQLHQAMLNHITHLDEFFGRRLADEYIWDNIKRIELSNIILTSPPLDILSHFSLSQLFDKLVNITHHLKLYDETFTYKVLSLYQLMLLCKAMQKSNEELPLPSVKDIRSMLVGNFNVIHSFYQKVAFLPVVAKYYDTFCIMEKGPANKPVKKKYFLELFENQINVYKENKIPEEAAKELFSIPMAEILAISHLHDYGFSILTKQRMFFIQAIENNLPSIKTLWKYTCLTVIRLRKLITVIKFFKEQDPTSKIISQINYKCSISDLIQLEKSNPGTQIPDFNSSQLDIRNLLTCLSPPICNQQLTF